MGNRTLRAYYVYILASWSRRLYIGVTNDLERRLYEHRIIGADSFTARYQISRLVHIEVFDNPADAIAREKQLKNWRREKKIALIEAQNPDWNDLSRSWSVPLHSSPDSAAFGRDRGRK